MMDLHDATQHLLQAEQAAGLGTGAEWRWRVLKYDVNSLQSLYVTDAGQALPFIDYQPESDEKIDTADADLNLAGPFRVKPAICDCETFSDPNPNAP